VWENWGVNVSKMRSAASSAGSHGMRSPVRVGVARPARGCIAGCQPVANRRYSRLPVGAAGPWSRLPSTGNKVGRAKTSQNQVEQGRTHQNKPGFRHAGSGRCAGKAGARWFGSRVFWVVRNVLERQKGLGPIQPIDGISGFGCLTFARSSHGEVRRSTEGKGSAGVRKLRLEEKELSLGKKKLNLRRRKIKPKMPMIKPN
jgi:hypothetical protein